MGGHQITEQNPVLDVHGINVVELEIVMNEMRKLKMSADFFANTSHYICRCPGV